VLTRADADNFIVVLEGLRLLEDDYLGGLGSRGSGQVAFTNLHLNWRSRGYYEGREQQSTLMEVGEDRRLRRLANIKEAEVTAIINTLKQNLEAKS